MLTNQQVKSLEHVIVNIERIMEIAINSRILEHDAREVERLRIVLLIKSARTILGKLEIEISGGIDDPQAQARANVH